MAIREFKYTVTPDSIAGSTVSKGGVQGERNATKLIFELSASLQNKLSALVAEGDNKSFYYRFDCYDGAGGMYSTAPVEFDPSNETEFSHLIAKRQTEFGGTIQVYFVITLVNGKNTEDTADDTTELELYSYSIKLMLKALPNGSETEGEDYESITTLAMSVKQNAEAVAEANAKMQAVLRGTWKFDGGNASNKTEFTVSDEIKDGGANLVRSGAIKCYVDKTSAETAKTALKEYKTAKGKGLEHIDEVDKTVEELKKKSDDTVNHIIAEGELSADAQDVEWHYVLRSNGCFELDGKKAQLSFESLTFYEDKENLYFANCGSFIFPTVIEGKNFKIEKFFSIDYGTIFVSSNGWSWAEGVSKTGITSFYVGRGNALATGSSMVCEPTVRIRGKYTLSEVAE